MSSPEEKKQNKDNGMYPMRTIANLTGINPVTLRAWERRYGLIQPQRTAKGHRLYTEQDVARIHRVLELLQQGFAISQVGKIIDSSSENIAAPSIREEKDNWAIYRSDMLAAIEAYDESLLDTLYNDALSLYPDGLVNTHLSTPLLRELGQHWKDSADGIAREHFFTLYLRNKLGNRIHNINHQSAGPLLLISCLPGELHEVGMLFFAVNAVSHGYRVLLLGANIPLEQLPAVLSKRPCDAIVLSTTARPADRIINEQLATLVSQLSIPVFVGGTAAERYRGEISASGAICVGFEIQHALQQISEKLSLTGEAASQ